MIDTIKYKIPFYFDFTETVKSRGYTVRTSDNFLDVDRVNNKYYDRIVVGKFDVPVLLFTKSIPYGKDSIYIEFSLPKIWYGHNCLLVDEQSIRLILDEVEREIRLQYPNFPDRKLWVLQRVDLCYHWFFDDDKLKRYFDYLTFLRYPRKDVHIYSDETIMFSGRSYTIRFYKKFNEFISRGYKQLKIFDPVSANEALEISRDILRFEVELRRSHIISLFGYSAKVEDFLGKFYYTYLSKILSRFYTVKNPLTVESTKKIIKNIFNFPDSYL